MVLGQDAYCTAIRSKMVPDERMTDRLYDPPALVSMATTLFQT